MKKFELKRLPGRNGRRNWFRCNQRGVSISARVHFDFVWLSSIRVHTTRGQGLGTKVMGDLIAWAIMRNKGVRLLAEADHKCNQRRLERWYRRLGFRKHRETREFVYELSS